MKKRTFRTHYILLIGGRFFILLLLLFPLFMLSIFVRDYDTLTIFEIIISITFILGLLLLCLWVAKYLWHQCWGKIKLKNDSIVWKCFLCRSVEIPYENIKYVTVNSFVNENVYRSVDIYRTGFLYIIISTGEVPKDSVHKIHTKQGVIKFNYSKKLAEALINKIPQRYVGLLTNCVKRQR